MNRSNEPIRWNDSDFSTVSAAIGIGFRDVVGWVGSLCRWRKRKAGAIQLANSRAKGQPLPLTTTGLLSCTPFFGSLMFNSSYVMCKVDFELLSFILHLVKIKLVIADRRERFTKMLNTYNTRYIDTLYGVSCHTGNLTSSKLSKQFFKYIIGYLKNINTWIKYILKYTKL